MQGFQTFYGLNETYEQGVLPSKVETYINNCATAGFILLKDKEATRFTHSEGLLIDHVMHRSK